jgi:acyl-CoA synthetase (AMP-forming)/AMP-acid ligase II
VLLYSSGSTGMSKGIVQDHRNLVRGAQIVAGYLDLTAADHILAVLPFSFDYGLNQLLSALASACRITAADYLGLAELAQLLATVRPTGLAGVPSLWHDVVRGLQNGAIATADGQSLRYATNSGGRLWPDDILELRRRWPHLRLFSMYGLTEAFRSAFLPPEEIDRRPTSFGKALPGVELLLVEPDTDRLLTGEATGELVHAGALVAQGYWRRPADTAARFRPDPRGVPGRVVYSGDLVRRDADGFLYFVARLDRMLKVSGHRISPDEVAVAVTGMVGVGEVAVFGVDGGAAGHRIVLCAAGDPADRDLPSRIQGQCRSRLPAYMVPAVVRVLPALPRNQNGKIDILRLEREVACTDAR